VAPVTEHLNFQVFSKDSNDICCSKTGILLSKHKAWGSWCLHLA